MLPVGQQVVKHDIAGVRLTGTFPGAPAPDFAVADLDGRPFRLSEHRGQIVLLDFWATWCGACLGELPTLRQVQRDLAGVDFVLVSVSFDRDESVVRRFVTDRQLAWSHLVPGPRTQKQLSILYGLAGIPATFLIGPDGRVIARDLRGPPLLAAIRREIALLPNPSALPPSDRAERPRTSSAVTAAPPEATRSDPEPAPTPVPVGAVAPPGASPGG